MDAVHIVGAGGIGCAVGHALAGAGVAVTFVEADPDKLRRGEHEGVSLAGHPARRATFVPFADWAPPAGVPILLCTKCYDNAAVLDRLDPAAALVPIQNGFDPALEARGPQAEGVASFVSECDPHAPVARITRRGRLHLGVNGPPNEVLRGRVRDLAERLRGGPFRVEEVADIRPYKHTKLMYNAALSPLASVAGLDNGELLRRPALRRLFFALLRENHAILAHAGVPLGKVGPFHPATVARIL